MHDWEHVTSKAFAAIFPLSGTCSNRRESKDYQKKRRQSAHDADALNESCCP
jgi:hypothetical protein